MKKQDRKSRLPIYITAGAAVLVAVAVALFFILGGMGGTEQTASSEKPLVEAELYWNVDRLNYFGTNISRTPSGEEGYYYIVFAADGEQVRLPVASYQLANYIDTMDLMGLVFDENGVVVDAVSVEDCTGGYVVDRYYVESVEGDHVVCNYSYMYDSHTVEFDMNDQTKIYYVGGTGIFVGTPTDLRKEDKIIAVRNTEGDVTHIFTEHYTVPGDVYWNVDVLYNSTTRMTTREPDLRGYYTYTLAINGSTVQVQTRDLALANSMDAQGGRCFGLVFDENGYAVELIPATSVTGGAIWGSRYTVEYTTKDQLSVVYTYAPSIFGAVANAPIAPDCKIMDVSGLGPMGAYTELRPGDNIHCLLDCRGRVCLVFVITRDFDSPLYWNVDRNYNSSKLSTNRIPDEQGYYHFLMAAEGKQVKLKTKSKIVADKIDAKADRHFALYVEGDEIIEMYNSNAVLGGTYFASWFDVVKIEKNGAVTAERTIGGSLQGTQQTAIMAENCKVYNVSDSAEVIGEETTLLVGDRIHGETNRDGQLEVIYVVHRYGPTVKKCICGMTSSGQHFGACDGTLYEWKGWPTDYSLPTTSGYFYLMKDVKLNEVAVLGSEAQVCLDLNGFDVEGPSTEAPRYLSWRIYDFNSDKTVKSLTITDSSPDNSSRLSVNYRSNQIGGVVWLRGSNESVLNIYGGYYDATGAAWGASKIEGRAVAASAGTINMYSGTVNASGIQSKFGSALFLNGATMNMFGGTIYGGTASEGGGAVDVFNKSTLNMFGGTIVGGTAQYGGAINIRNKSAMNMLGGTVTGGTSTGSGGGAIIVQEGKFNMTGGTVKNGKATKGAAYGGNIYGFHKDTVINIRGGYIIGGEAKYGGNVFINNKAGSTLNISGGNITNGKVSEVGGNVYMYTDSILNMTGGVIKGGTNDEGAGDNLYCFKNKNTITGGTIAGYMECNNATLELGKSPVIYDAKATRNLMLNGTVITPVSAFEKANVHIFNTGIKLMDYSKLATDQYLSFIHSDKEGWISKEEDGIYLRHPLDLTHCVCGLDENGEHFGDCDKADHIWSVWEDTTNLPKSSGYYYLLNDVQLTEVQLVADGADVHLDLNGRTVYGPVSEEPKHLSWRIYDYNSTDSAKSLTITDSSEGNTGKMVVCEKSNQVGGVIWVRGSADSVLNIYGGHIDGTGAFPEKSVIEGRVLAISKGTWNLYDGIIDGTGLNGKFGTTVTTYGAKAINIHGGEIRGGNATEGGGAMHLPSGIVTFSGGTVVGGTAQYGGALNIQGAQVIITDEAVIDGGTSTGSGGGAIIIQSGSLTMNGGTVKNGNSTTGSGYGGNVFVYGGSGLFVLNDGTVEAGNAKFGGNIFLHNKAGATAQLHGGSVINGTCANNGAGGNIYAYNHSLVQMSGGTVENGKRANGTADNMMLFYATLDMTGGTIAGAVLSDHATLKLGGSPVIDGPTSADLNLNGSLIVPTAAFEGASIHINNVGIKIMELSELATDDYLACITNESGGVVVREEDGIYIRIDESIQHCLCALDEHEQHFGHCDQTEHKWQKWTDTTSLPTDPGYYYLSAPVDLTAAWNMSSGAYYIDLAGHSITQTTAGQHVLFFTGTAKATFTDSVGGGKVVGASGSRMIQLSSGTALDLYGGTLDATAASADYGVCMNVNGSTVNMYGGSVLGGTATATSGGGAVIVQSAGTFNLYGGVITGGTNSAAEGCGGAVTTWNAASVFNQYGGTVEGGKAKFGATVFVKDGTYNFIDGNINGSEATYGGAVYVLSKAKGFVMTGGTLTGGTVKEGGGAIDVNGGTVSVSGGTVKGGKAQYGGAVDLRGGGSMTLSGSGVIDGGSSTGSGGGAVIIQGATFTMNGGTVKNGDASTGTGYGGNVFLFSATSRFIMNDGIIESGNAKFGGNIFANNKAGAAVEIHGGTVRNGICANSGAGGNIYMYTGSVLTVDGGLIAGGKRVNGNLDSIMIMNATFNLRGGSIEGGVSVNSGTVNLSGSPVIYKEGASFNLSLGGSVVMNLTAALDDAANIHISNAVGKKLIGIGTLDPAAYTHAASRIISDVGGSITVEADGIYVR